MTNHYRSASQPKRIACMTAATWFGAFGREVSGNLPKVGDARTILAVSLPVPVIPPTSTWCAVPRMTKAVSEARITQHLSRYTFLHTRA